MLSTWISNHIQYKMWDEITDPSPNFNAAVWEKISNSSHTLLRSWSFIYAGIKVSKGASAFQCTYAICFAAENNATIYIWFV